MCFDIVNQNLYFVVSKPCDCLKQITWSVSTNRMVCLAAIGFTTDLYFVVNKPCVCLLQTSKQTNNKFWFTMSKHLIDKVQLRFLSQSSSRTEKIRSVVRETCISRHNGGHNQKPTQTHKYDSGVMAQWASGGPELSPMIPTDASLPDSYTSLSETFLLDDGHEN